MLPVAAQKYEAHYLIFRPGTLHFTFVYLTVPIVTLMEVGGGDGEAIIIELKHQIFWDKKCNVNCPSFKYLNISSTISTNHSDYKNF